MDIILASASPRRKDLLGQIGVSFRICPSNFEEVFSDENSVEGTVMALAFQKGMDIATKHPNDYVLSADTIVVVDNEILGKPKSEEEAFSMLKRLSGRSHRVLTGVALIHEEKELRVIEYEETKVAFHTLSDDQILSYIKKAKPLDKAGSYGIQDLGAVLVKEIVGDYFNVVGLPVSKVARLLEKYASLPIL